MTLTDFSIVVLISGHGSNLQALLDHSLLAHHIKAVIANKADAYGLVRARHAHIPTHVIDHHAYQGREAFDAALRETIDRYQPHLVILAGFMRILTPSFIDHYLGRLINIHPSLLPQYKGLGTHQRVLNAGDNIHGATVHFVVPELDSGPILLQATVPVLPTDDETTLKERVHAIEHKIYPLAIQWFAEGRIRFHHGIVYFDQQPVLPGGIRYEDTPLLR